MPLYEVSYEEEVDYVEADTLADACIAWRSYQAKYQGSEYDDTDDPSSIRRITRGNVIREDRR